MKSTKGKPFAIVAGNAGKVMDSLVPAPLLMIGATDSRCFGQVSDGVINFSASSLMEGYHGIDERLSVLEFQRMYTFLVHVLRSIE
jgi:carboxypeptidase PM20D1